MDNFEKERLVRMTTTVYAWIVGISIVFYILIIFCGITFPYSLIKHTNEGYSEFKNYGFLIVRDEFSIFYRFQSIFTEPGHVGMIASLILYVNKYKLKKISVFIILVGLLLSFSLAAYVLLALGYCIYQFAGGKRIYKKIIIVLSIAVLLGGTGLYLYKEYPDSIVTTLIVNRMQYDEEKGIAGNNRIGAGTGFDYYYNKYFLGTSDMIWGAGPELFQEKFSWGVNSYKSFFHIYGFVGIILLFLFYFSMSIHSRLSFGLFIVYCASFLQRTYALWEMELFLFVGAMGVFHERRKTFSI
jgi:hypothetical protein